MPSLLGQGSQENRHEFILSNAQYLQFYVDQFPSNLSGLSCIYWSLYIWIYMAGFISTCDWYFGAALWTRLQGSHGDLRPKERQILAAEFYLRHKKNVTNIMDRIVYNGMLRHICL